MCGQTYYLHAGTTKTGKPRYVVAKTIGNGALTVIHGATGCRRDAIYCRRL